MPPANLPLARLASSNFLSHRDTVIDFNRVTLVFGRNMAGKTSVRDAIEYALTGLCRGLDRKNQSGLLANDLVNEPGVVTLELGDGRTIRRKTGASGKPADIDSDLAAVLCNHLRLLHMPPKDRASLVAKSNLGSGMIDAAFRACNFPDYEKLPASLLSMPAAAIDKAEAFAVNQRRECGSDMRALQTPKPVAEQVDTHDGDRIAVDSLNLADTEAAIAELVKQHKSLVAKSAGGENVNREQLVANLEALRDEVTELEARDFAKERQVAGDARQKLEELASTQRATLARLDADVAETEQRLSRMRARDCKACPTCGADWNSAQLRAVREKLEDALKESRAAQVRQGAKLRETEGKLRDARSALAAIVEAQDAAPTKINRLRHSISENERLLAAADCIAEVGPQITELEARIARGRSIRDAVLRYTDAVAQWESNQQKIESYQAKYARWDDVAHALGKGGAVREACAKLASKGFQPAPALCAAMDCDVQFSADGMIEARFGDSTMRPLGLLSESQQWIACAAIAVGLAVLSGQDFVILDAADILVDPYRSGLMDWMVRQNAVQVVLIGTVNGDAPAPGEFTEQPGVTTHWVEGGTVRQLVSA